MKASYELVCDSANCTNYQTCAGDPIVNSKEFYMDNYGWLEYEPVVGNTRYYCPRCIEEIKALGLCLT